MFLASCGNDDKRLEEVSGIQGQEAAERQIEEQNRNQAVKANEMEQELKLRKVYYNALIGDYEGETEIQGVKSIFTLSVQQNNVPAPSNRVRTLEEIANDLNQLSLSILIKHGAVGSEAVPTNCKIIGVKPDINKGMLSLASQECPNFYQIFISREAQDAGNSEVGAQTYSQEIYLEEEQPIPFLKGFINPGSTLRKIPFLLKRN
jgi:hypothetical protein